MGQKVHPIGFRLGITQLHLSHWFASKQNYSEYLFEDNFLRKELYKQFNNAGIEKIEISRKIKNHLDIIIYAEKLDIIVGKKGKDLNKFKNKIKQIVFKYRKSKFFKVNFSNNNEKYNSNIKTALYITSCSSNSASSIANFLIELLENRVPYRTALNLLFKKKVQKKYKGIKIQISGRLNGAEIARKEWIRDGCLPLQTLKAKIDYSYKQAYTIYGVLGIKVWVFN